jgi:transposase-like protein
MKFNTSAELFQAAHSLPINKNGNPRTTPAFRKAYVDFCERNRFSLAKFATPLGFSESTPYMWKTNLLRQGEYVIRPDPIRALQDEIAELETKLTTLNDQLALLEKLEGLGYKITKE